MSSSRPIIAPERSRRGRKYTVPPCNKRSPVLYSGYRIRFLPGASARRKRAYGSDGLPCQRGGRNGVRFPASGSL